jgi:hypothetical protein
MHFHLHVQPQDQNHAGRTDVDARKVNLDQLCLRDRVKGRLLMASIRGPGNQGWGIREGPFPLIKQFRSVSITIVIVEKSVSHPPEAEDATEKSITWIHMNRLIKKYDLDVLFVSGPGHGAPAILSQSYLEGVYSEVYPDKSEDIQGMQRFFKRSHFQAVLAAMRPLRLPGVSMRVVNWDILSRTLSGQSSTIPTS